MHRHFQNGPKPATALLCLLAAILPGCAARAVEKPEAKLARSQAERGPVRLTVEVEPAPARLSDEPTMTVTIDYLKGVTVDKPVFGEALGEFRIAEVRQPLPQVKGDREIVRQILALQPTRTGRLTIFPIGVTFTDSRPDGDGRQHTVECKEIAVEVTSVVQSEDPSLDELHKAAEPVELPRNLTLLLFCMANVLLLIGAAAGFWIWRRRERASDFVPPTARELAYRELQQLIESGLAARDVKQFYVELTGIVRRYIERTTSIRAPEQTTEEFLREISRRQTFPPEESGRLKHFLEAADLVKFAAHRPRQEDVDDSIQRAKDFIGYRRAEVAA